MDRRARPGTCRKHLFTQFGLIGFERGFGERETRDVGDFRVQNRGLLGGGGSALTLRARLRVRFGVRSAFRWCGAFPGLDGAGGEAEEGVGIRLGQCAELAVEAGVAGAEFGQEVLPFVLELAAGFGDLAAGARAGDFGGVEVVAAAGGFAGKGGEEGGDGGEGFVLGAKTEEVRVVAVAAGFSGEDFLGQECFAPGGDESAGVEVAGVEGPESHGEIVGEFRVQNSEFRIGRTA